MPNISIALTPPSSVFKIAFLLFIDKSEKRFSVFSYSVFVSLLGFEAFKSFEPMLTKCLKSLLKLSCPNCTLSPYLPSMVSNSTSITSSLSFKFFLFPLLIALSSIARFFIIAIFSSPLKALRRTRAFVSSLFDFILSVLTIATLLIGTSAVLLLMDSSSFIDFLVFKYHLF